MTADLDFGKAFAAHVGAHFATRMALQRAKDLDDPQLLSMIEDALRGTWTAAQAYTLDRVRASVERVIPAITLPNTLPSS